MHFPRGALCIIKFKTNLCKQFSQRAKSVRPSYSRNVPQGSTSANWFKVIVHLSIFVGLSPLPAVVCFVALAVVVAAVVVVVVVVVDSYWLFGSVISRSEFFISNWICCTSGTHIARLNLLSWNKCVCEWVCDGGPAILGRVQQLKTNIDYKYYYNSHKHTHTNTDTHATARQ